MKLKIEKSQDQWYFSVDSGFLGLGAERTQAIYSPKQKVLTLRSERTKYLPAIFDFLIDTLDETNITVLWYKKDKRK